MEETRWKEKIKPLDENAMEEARARWMTVGKPLFSLGSLEDAVIQIAKMIVQLQGNQVSVKV